MAISPTIETKYESALKNNDMCNLKHRKTSDIGTTFLEAWQEAKESQIKEVTTGGQSFTNKEWDTLLAKFDKVQTAIMEEVKNEVKEKLENATGITTSNAYFLRMDKSGQINYNGVTFNCDTINNEITLGDCSNPAECITVYLEKGGKLVFNKKDTDALLGCLDMFSPEDICRILCAIADDKKISSTELEIENSGIEAMKDTLDKEI